MQVSIEYCVMWNYYPTAASLAEEIKKHFSIDAELIKSSGGLFEVRKDGDLIFSKKAMNRFPSTEEIIEKLRSWV